jgi:DNA-binding transcriptional ArsR family regulator
MSRETEVRWDTMLGILSDGQRRRVYRYVAERERPVSLDEIARHLLDGRDVDADELARVRARIYHVHLPKLEDVALVSWDGVDQISRGVFSDHLSPEVVSPPSTVGTGCLGGADD